MDELTLSEAGFTLSESALQDDGTVLIHVIRPGIGRGRGRRYYSPDMLRESAGKWAGMKMYANHLSEKAKKALEGLPRPTDHAAGRILESWWDDTVPADGRFEQGAVVARVKPVGHIKALIEDDPELLETSISAQATAIHTATKRGERVAVVEGIAPHPQKPHMNLGSVDFVTEAGAGGKVLAAIQEAEDSGDDGLADLLETYDDDDLRTYLAENRPELAEALGDQPESGDAGAGKPDEEESVDITPEALSEALKAPEMQEVLAEIVNPLVEAKVADERDDIIRQAQFELRREVELRDMQTEAHKQIAEAALPPKFEAAAKKRYALVEGNPTTALDVWPELDVDGGVVKTATEKLTESVEACVEEMRDLAGDAKPTKVTGQGRTQSTKLTEGDGGGGDEPTTATAKDRVDPGTRAMLREGGMSDEEIDETYKPENHLTGVVG